jgi:hypothetical protein
MSLVIDHVEFIRICVTNVLCDERAAPGQPRRGNVDGLRRTVTPVFESANIRRLGTHRECCTPIILA